MMSIRIVHTADNHIDLGFKTYPETAKNILKVERMESFANIVRTANDKKAHFLVVAGDLFDGINPATKIIKQVVQALGEFDGTVLVLPGNHDYYSGLSSELWNRFVEESQEKQITVLLEPIVKEFEIEGQKVQFFPCPCRSKTSKQNAIGWTFGAPRNPDAIQVGIAHGNVDGLGLDADDKYFNMSRTELRSAKMHAWLLGHIHRPFPDRGGSDPPDFFMAGSHAPQSVLRNHPGSAWFITLNTNGEQYFEKINCSRIEFHRISHTLNSVDGIAGLKGILSKLVPENVVLDLILDGSLNDADFNCLSTYLDNLNTQGGFLHVRHDSKDVIQELSVEQIQARFTNNSFANRLLTKLIESGNKNDARIALKLIEGIVK